MTERGLVAAIDFCIYTRNAALQTMRDRRQKMVSQFFYAPNVSLFLCVDVIERHELSVSFYFNGIRRQFEGNVSLRNDVGGGADFFLLALSLSRRFLKM